MQVLMLLMLVEWLVWKMVLLECTNLLEAYELNTFLSVNYFY